MRWLRTIGVGLVILVVVWMVELTQEGLTVPILSRIRTDSRTLSSHLMLYHGLNGFYPSTAQGLGALVERPMVDPIPKNWSQMLTQVPPDPWGRPYVYHCENPYHEGSYRLFSLGRDGIESGDDIVAHVSNP